MRFSVQRTSAAALVAFLMALAQPAFAQVSGTVRVSVRDQQNLALPGAAITIKAAASAWTQSTIANADGDATFPAVPLGQYQVTATLDGFAAADRQIAVFSNAVTPVQLQLKVAGVAESVEVTGVVQTINPESSRTENLVQRRDILQQPDADRSGSLAMITNNTPGAYVMH